MSKETRYPEATLALLRKHLDNLLERGDLGMVKFKAPWTEQKFMEKMNEKYNFQPALTLPVVAYYRKKWFGSIRVFAPAKASAPKAVDKAALETLQAAHKEVRDKVNDLIAVVEKLHRRVEALEDAVTKPEELTLPDEPTNGHDVELPSDVNDLDDLNWQ